MFLTYCSVAVAAASIGISNYRETNNDLGKIDQMGEALLIQEGASLIDFNQYYIKDLNDNLFLVKTADKAFTIIDVKTSLAVEIQTNMSCPYSFSLITQGNNYYFGFGNYYLKTGTKYKNLLTGRYISERYIIDYQNDFDYQLKQIRNEIDANDLDFDIVSSLENTEAKYVSNYEILKYDKYIINDDGSCGYIAASSVLNYYSKTLCSEIVDQKYYDDNGNLKDDNNMSLIEPDDNLKDKLLSFKPDERPESYGVDIQLALMGYLADQNIYWPTNEITYFVPSSIGLTAILDQNIPVIASGCVPNPDNLSNMIFHSFVIYGYRVTNGVVMFLANWGWGDDNVSVTLPFGYVASYVYIDFNLQSFKKTITINPNNLESTNAYSSTLMKTSIPYSTSKPINIEFNILSESFRCGVFENEFNNKVISLSSRKNGYCNSFLRLSFSEPVTKFKIELSKWSNNERVNETNGVAIIKYKNVYYPRFDIYGFSLDDVYNEVDYEMKKWNTAFDIYNECVLGDMSSTITINLDFPNGTREIEICSQFNGINNSVLDYGRLCIHKMEAVVYA